MLKYTVTRINEAGHIQDVSIFNASEYDLANFVKGIQERIYPAHKVSVDVAFTNCWRDVVSTKRFKEYKQDLKATK
jgi:hypothetical protein